MNVRSDEMFAVRSLNVNCISLTHLKTIEILEYTLQRQHQRSNTGTRKRMFVFLLCLFKSQSSLYGKRSKVVVDEKKQHKKKRPTSSSSRRSSSQSDRSSTKLVSSVDISSLDSDALDAFRRRETICRSSNKDAKEETAVPPAPTSQQRDSARDTMMGFSPSPPPPPSPALRDVVEFKERDDMRIWKRVSEFLNTQHSSKSRRMIMLRPFVSGFRPVTPPLSTRHHRRNQYRTLEFDCSFIRKNITHITHLPDVLAR